ncbi:MAG: hypothetical protein JWR50_1134 [Mucilaginibacter sp.]|nr:hypothetical protein [Mucilaginibacter sp.]
MNKQRVLELLKEYQDGKISAENRILLENWYHQQALNSKDELSAKDLKKSIEYLKGRLPLNSTEAPSLNLYRNHKLGVAFAIAASLLLIVSSSVYFFRLSREKEQNMSYVREIASPQNTAVLTLGSGKQIQLNNVKSGLIAKQGDKNISKQANGTLAYNNATPGAPTESSIIYNTVTTSKGGKFELVLSDGSRVMLNAHSSLTFPTSFSSLSDRRVQLIGEAYFEVAHNKASPFRVTSGKHTVEVLGTHFNVMAYPDEKMIETTLIQGSVKVSVPGSIKIIKPGQQARATETNLQIEEHVDTDDVLAWKNGYFIFNDDDLNTIMRKISRWYDVDVTYDQAGSDIRSSRFGGIVSRARNLSVVLNTMERTGKVKFKVTGRRITVTK